jgi:hypothetical protein
VPLEGARARRIIVAVLANISNWESRLDEIAAAAIPATGNKARALALQRDLMLARLSLCRLAGMDGDQICQQPADDKPPDT